MSFRRSLLLLLFFLGVSSIYGAPNADDPEKDAAMDQLLQDARQLIDAKKLPAAVQKCDQIITRYRKHYSERKEKVYCARTSAENLGYLVMSAAEMNKGTATKEGAITLSATWSNAYFLKAYALQEMGRMAEAKAALKEAVQLAPWNPQYLCELGSIYQLEKDWPRAREVFELAEDQAALSPASEKAAELARARRGVAYVLVELGQLDAAEKKYQQCLKDDSNDSRAAKELEYVRGLREKKGKRPSP